MNIRHPMNNLKLSLKEMDLKFKFIVKLPKAINNHRGSS